MRYTPVPRQIVVKGGMHIKDQEEATELLARHFAGKSKDKHDGVQFVLSEASVDDQTGYNKQITMVEPTKAIQSSTSKAPGPDTIPYIFIEKLTTQQMEHLLLFLNYVYINGVPRQWKEAIVIPLLKAGKIATELESYRPISLTNCLSKLLEKILNWRLQSFLDDQKFYSAGQCGFRAQHGTLDSLACIEDSVRESLLCDNYCIAILLDVDKAFDTVQHDEILIKLEKLGIKGNLIRFIGNFLSHRSIKVTVNNKL